MNLNKFNFDLGQRIKSYQDNILKENKYTSVNSKINPKFRGGSLKSSFVLPNGNVDQPDNFTLRGTLEGGKKKKVNRLKKAERWRDFTGDTLGIGLDLGDKALDIKDKHDPKMQAMKSAKKIFGGKKKINRLKKAERWRDFSGDTVSQGLDLVDKALTIKDKHDPKSKAQASISKAFGGGIKKPSKARINSAVNKLEAFMSGASKLKPTALQIEVLQEAGIIESKGGSIPKIPDKKCQGGAQKAPSAWVTHVKAYAKSNNVSYKDAMKQAGASYNK